MREPEVAATLARLVLDGEGSAPVGDVGWAEFLRMAESNGVAVRVVDRLRARGTMVPDSVSAAVQVRRERAREMFEAMTHVADLCYAHGIAWCFPKALQHLPDIGRDIDLLVEAGSGHLDDLLRRELGAVPVARGFRFAITGSTQYRLPAQPATLDVHLGRLGVVGEHSGFPADLLRRCGAIEVAGRRFNVPRSEDRLVLQGLQMVYGRTAIRVADVVSTITLVRGVKFDWDEVISTSVKVGTAPGLSCYLSYVDRIHADLFGSPLPCPPQARSLIRWGWGRVSFTQGRYRFPILAVNCRLYLERFVSDIVSGRWASAGRLCLLPGLAAAAAGQRAARRLRPAPAATQSPAY